MSRRSKRRPVIGYKINGLIHAPSEVIIVYGPPPHGVLNNVWWFLRHWTHNHRKGILIVLLVIGLCILSSVITAHFPT
jgi:hypothetical protein